MLNFILFYSPNTKGILDKNRLHYTNNDTTWRTKFIEPDKNTTTDCNMLNVAFNSVCTDVKVIFLVTTNAFQRVAKYKY